MVIGARTLILPQELDLFRTQAPGAPWVVQKLFHLLPFTLLPLPFTLLLLLLLILILGPEVLEVENSPTLGVKLMFKHQ